MGSGPGGSGGGGGGACAQGITLFTLQQDLKMSDLITIMLILPFFLVFGPNFHFC